MTMVFRSSFSYFDVVPSRIETQAQNISSFISAVTRPPTVQAAPPPSAEASTTEPTTPTSQSSNLCSNQEFSSSSLLNVNVASHPSASQDVLK
jgi:hypothetical protein